MASVDDYLALITSEHAGKPKFAAMVAAVAQAFADVQSVLAEVNPSYDLDAAVGAQLDVIGLWVGISRVVRTPIEGVYFTWGDAATPLATGWSYGTWKGAFDPSTGIESLPDDAYRIIIRAKIVANGWDGSIPGAYAIWAQAFANSGSTLFIQDGQDMTMAVGVANLPLSGLNRALLIGGYLPVKPAGVAISKYALSIIAAPLFGWGVVNNTFSGWGAGGWPEIVVV